MNKVIFLDLDGVVRVEFDEGWQFCIDRINKLKDFCNQNGYKIVMSSDWRYSDTFFEREDLKIITDTLDGLFHEDWRTTTYDDHEGIILEENCLRWKEVEKWLVAHPENDSYIILEDFPELFDGAPEEMRNRIILCETSTGLTSELFNRMEELNNE